MWGDQRVNCGLCHTTFYGSAMQRHTKQCAVADRGEICIVYIQVSPPSEILGDHQVGNHWQGPG
ncbi:unnamed protein product, partial [Staurois parvus]